MFLSTAIVDVEDENNILPCRVLLDSGSQNNFIPAKLKIIPCKISHCIKGIGELSTHIDKQVKTIT